MADSDDRDVSSAVEKFLARTEGYPLVYQQAQNEPVRCDACTEIIRPNRRFITWWIVDDDGGWTGYRFQCLDCTPRPAVFGRLGLSPEGEFEMLTEQRLTTEKTMADIELYHYSLPSEGGAWDMEGILKAAFGFEDEGIEWLVDGAGFDGPYDVVAFLLRANIDIRPLFDEEGVTHLPKSEQDANRQRALEHGETIDPEAVRRYYEKTKDVPERQTVLGVGESASDVYGDPEE